MKVYLFLFQNVNEIKNLWEFDNYIKLNPISSVNLSNNMPILQVRIKKGETNMKFLLLTINFLIINLKDNFLHDS